MADAYACPMESAFCLDADCNCIDVATQTVADVGVNVGVTDHLLALLAKEPKLSAKKIAGLLNKTTPAIERHPKALREQRQTCYE
jgi:hypothetical protein